MLNHIYEIISSTGTGIADGVSRQTHTLQYIEQREDLLKLCGTAARRGTKKTGKIEPTGRLQLGRLATDQTRWAVTKHDFYELLERRNLPAATSVSGASR